MVFEYAIRNPALRKAEPGQIFHTPQSRNYGVDSVFHYSFRMNHLRYFPFSQYVKQRFGERVHKVAVDAGFTCPNRDGVKGMGGCAYCNNEGFSFNSRVETRPIDDQLQAGIAFMKKRFRARKFMAYFQASSNTYAPLPRLKQVYDVVLPFEDIVAMSVGTRPDCISTAALNLLESYSDKREVWIEYGLQSTHNRTLERIQRGDTYERFLSVIEQSAQRNLKICVHVILGLPGETHQDMMDTADRLASLPYHSIKIHLFHVMKNTPLEGQYAQGIIKVFELSDYVDTCCDFVERLRPDISIQRLTADAPPEVLVAPQWCLQRKQVVEAIQNELERRGSSQGTKCVTELAAGGGAS